MKITPLVKDYMAKKLITVSPTSDVFKAIKILLKNNISGAPVVNENGRLVGLLSEIDCLRVLSKGKDGSVPKTSVADFMSRKVYSISPDADIYQAVDVVLQQAYRRIPVVDKIGKLVGQISRRDLLRAIQENIRAQKFTGDITEAKLIRRDKIEKLRFPKGDVLGSTEAIDRRSIKLENAVRLGSIGEHKVTIIFGAIEGMRKVRNTVQSKGKKFISLKGSLTIPVNRIYEINIL